jgi:HTH-type transcriptional regulator / antitoxin HigA
MKTSSSLKIDFVDHKTNYEFHLPVSFLKKPKSAKEYAKLEKILDELIDRVRDNNKHPLADIMQIIGENLEQYDNEHFPEVGSDISEVEMVKFLMTSHNLQQSDLADIFGGQGNVSKFLNGERPLSKNQIAGLKKRFKISSDIFVK